METSSQLWEIIEADKVLEPITLKHSHHIKNAVLFEITDDQEDGTYPRVSDWTRFANSVDSEGASAWINRLSRKKNKSEIEYWGCKIVRDSKWSDRAVIEFKEPVKVVFGRVGDEPIVKQVKKISGEFTHDWFWMKSGRQDKIANGVEIWFNIEEYLE